MIPVPSISLGHNFRTIFHLDDFLLEVSLLVIIAIFVCIKDFFKIKLDFEIIHIHMILR